MSQFKCNYCGKEYDTVEGMATCILECSEKKKREEEIRRKEELNKQKGIRESELLTQIDKLLKDVEQYEKDYNIGITYKMTSDLATLSTNNLMNVISRFWNDVINT